MDESFDGCESGVWALGVQWMSGDESELGLHSCDSNGYGPSERRMWAKDDQMLRIVWAIAAGLPYALLAEKSISIRIARYNHASLLLISRFGKTSLRKDNHGEDSRLI